MSSASVGLLLRTAREQRGWSREELAYHSGVSWSAISQIESGRRQDPHLSSVSSLARALEVSIDYLCGHPHTQPLLEHRAFEYQSDDEYLALATAFLIDGLDRAHSMLAILGGPQAGKLRRVLGPGAARVEFTDASSWCRSPKVALGKYQEFLRRKIGEGAPRIGILAHPVWAGRRSADVHAWARLESLLNLIYGAVPATILCAYDLRRVSPESAAYARQTHPELIRGSDAHSSPGYRDPAQFLLESRSLRVR